MSNKRCLVLGYLGFQSNQLDGQTVKTRNMLRLLQQKHVECEYFDTEDLKLRKVVFFTMLRKVMRSDVIFYLPAHNNLKYFFPLLYVVVKIFKIQLYYFVVGGWLPTYLQNKKARQKMLSRIDGIFCETNAMIETLQKHYGFQNVQWFPNFRIHQYTPFQNNQKGVLRMVFFSRINRKKGIDFVLSYAKHIDEKKLPVTIDFYGPVADADAHYFHSAIEQCRCVCYCGILQPDSVYETLNKYDVLVLPTKYFTEGFPGAVLDAYIAGIPVIVSEWKHAHEFVEHENTGLIFKFEDERDFFMQIDRIVRDFSLVFSMKVNAHMKSRQFSSEHAWELISSIFGR